MAPNPVPPCYAAMRQGLPYRAKMENGFPHPISMQTFGPRAAIYMRAV